VVNTGSAPTIPDEAGPAIGDRSPASV